MAPISDAFRMIIVVLCVTHCVVSLHDSVELLQVPTILNRLEDQNGNLDFLAKLDPLTLDVQGVEHPRMNSLVPLILGLMEEDDLQNIGSSTRHGPVVLASYVSPLVKKMDLASPVVPMMQK